MFVIGLGECVRCCCCCENGVGDDDCEGDGAPETEGENGRICGLELFSEVVDVVVDSDAAVSRSFAFRLPELQPQRNNERQDIMIT